MKKNVKKLNLKRVTIVDVKTINYLKGGVDAKHTDYCAVTNLSECIPCN